MQFPGPVRAVVGLVANAAEEAKHLPDRAIELPMLAVSTALQLSLRAQQRYARLAARGDEVLNRRRAGDEPPSWATFDDDPVPVDQSAARPGDRARAASELLDEMLGGADPDTEEPTRPPAPAKKVSPSAGGPRIANAAATPSRDATPAADARATKVPAKRTPKKTAGDPAKGKSVTKPRNTPPSRFDAVDDE